MRRYRRRRKLFKIKLKKETVYAIFQVSLFVSAGVIILSFSQQGPLLSKIYFVLHRLFGWTILFFPLILVSLALTLSKIKSRLTKPNIFLGILLLFISLLGISKAGVFGHELWLNLSVLLTGIGSFIILAGAFILGFIVLFETSIDEIAVIIIKTVRQTTDFCKKYIISGFFKRKKIITGKQEILVKGLEEGKIQDDRRKTEMKKDKIEEKQRIESGKKEAMNFVPELVSNVPGETHIWNYPPVSLLSNSHGGKADRGNLKENAVIIEKTLQSFGIQARVAEVNCGPAVTQYALEIAMGTKLSKITALSNDLALALAAPTGQIRIEAPIPGRSLVGVEVPNRSLEIVTLKKMLESSEIKKKTSKIALSLGLDVSGKPLIADLAKMPHILIAGATGSGKSICINSFIATLLFRCSPQELKLILIDPKRVELTIYNNIPHLLTPVIVNLEKILSALKWTLLEMERRYKLFAAVSCRNIESYNELSGFQALPYIVIIIDELADVMMFAPAEVEDAICRIAQMARATGIHLIVSTQRPSVDVLTGLIKANIPCRIAFNVISNTDSRVILDMPGAEKLLGSGDMLYIPPDQAKPSRVQGAFVPELEVQRLVKFLKNQGVPLEYTEEVTTVPLSQKITKRGVIMPTSDEEKDELFNDALRVACQYDRASASLLQRRLSIGYARAARILDQLEAEGIVGPAEGSKPREVLMRSAEEYFRRQAGQ